MSELLDIVEGLALAIALVVVFLVLGVSLIALAGETRRVLGLERRDVAEPEPEQPSHVRLLDHHDWGFLWLD